MPDIVLATLNAKFIHAAFGLRYLFANLGELQPRAVLAEFDINQRPLDIAEALLARQPKIIGLGVYIWNAAATTEVVSILKRVRPEMTIILGGPEVSYETETQEIVRLADHVITGEADLQFAAVCRKLLGCPSSAGLETTDDHNQIGVETGASFPKIIPAGLPEFSHLVLPYDFYTDADLAHRIVYVEASRGCPFTCDFCLSSLDIPVRAAPLEPFLGAMQQLLNRGLRQFKFVDRTFNLNLATSRAILEFFLARHRPGNFYHFEMIPDRLPAELREVIGRFPPGALQFEVGVQTFNPEVGQRISRRQNYERLADNLDFLRNHTRVHIHADLIVGLPGETVACFAAGFDRLMALGPQEIQVGILKRLRGTPIGRHDTEWGMVYHAQPPYEILQNRLIDFATMQRLRRLAKYWELAGNSGNFVETIPLLWRGESPVEVAKGIGPAGQAPGPVASDGNGQARQVGADDGAPVLPLSPFASFLRFSDWLYLRLGRTDSIALARLAELIYEFLTGELKLPVPRVAAAMSRDWQRGGRRDVPDFLRELQPGKNERRGLSGRTLLPKRQARHLGV